MPLTDAPPQARVQLPTVTVAQFHTIILALQQGVFAEVAPIIARLDGAVLEQIPAPQAKAKAKAKPTDGQPRPRGRPPGSRNKPKAAEPTHGGDPVGSFT